MLILTRKIDQGIVISGNIYVRVLGVERDRVKIGISAPSEITVLRQELLDSDRKPRNEMEGQNAGTNGGGVAPVARKEEPEEEV
jgi:carbon storage regulator